MAYKHNPNQTDEEYRKALERSMENLADSLSQMGYPAPRVMSDERIIELAVKKLRTLHKMILATGFSENMLKVIMSE